jgi:hypothetical protein
VAQITYDTSRNCDRVFIIARQVVRDTAFTRVHQPTAERFLINIFSGRGPHKRWPGKKYVSLFANDDVLICHGGNVRATCDGDTVDNGNLRNSERGHLGL